MKNLLIVFFIVLLILCVLFFSFKTRMMAHFNFLSLKGFYSFKIWRLKLLCGMIEKNDSGELTIINTNNILKGDFNKPFMKELSKEISSRVDVKKIEIFFTGGFVDDSFTSAILCGTVSSLVQSVYSYLSLKYDDVRLYDDIDPTYNESNLEITFEAVISISIFKLIMSLIKANIKTKRKEIKNEG